MREKIIRVFVSSTFLDFECERNLFQKNIEQELSEEYKKKGWQIEFIDLRWGIASEVKNVMSVCIDELEKCKTVSPIPFLFILLGNRYGWIPMPEFIYESQWHYILNNIREDNNILVNNYIEDGNNIPKRYLLKAHLDDKSDEYQELLSLFNDVEKQYKKNLDLVINDWVHLAQSATHNEILHGIDVLGGDSSKTLCFFRDIKDEANDYFIDQNEKVEQLKEDLITKIDPHNIIKCSINFNEYSTLEYIETIKELIISKLKPIIDTEILNYDNSSIDNDFYFQEQFVCDRLKIFAGRETEEDLFNEFITKQNKILVSGRSGSGKSSFMAKLYSNYKNNREFDAIFCSTGESPSAHIGIDILSYIVSRLRGGANVEKSFDLLLDYIIKHNEKNVIVFIDAINQLHPTDPLLKLLNMNFSSESKMKFVFSVIEEDVPEELLTSYKVERKNKIILSSFKTIGNTVSIDIIKNYLQVNNRTITTEQEFRVKEILRQKEFASALYLRLLSLICALLNHRDEVKISSGFKIERDENDINTFYIPENEKDIIKGVVAYYSNEKKHCDTMTKIALSFISNSLRGVTYGEMLELMSRDEDTFKAIKSESKHEFYSNVHKLPPTVWSHLYYDIKHLLSTNMVLGGEVITYYHAVIKESVRELFANTEELHGSLGLLLDYHKNQWQEYAAVRSIEELPEMYIKLQRYDELAKLLLDIDYIQAKVENDRVYDLIREYEVLCTQLSDRLLDMVYKNIKRYHQVLVNHSMSDKNFVLQFISNLYADGELKSLVSEYIAEKWNTESQPVLLKILNLPFYDDNCAIGRELHGAAWSISDLDITSDGRWCLSVDDDKVCRVWDMDNGELENIYIFHNEEIKYCKIIDKDKQIALSSSQKMLCFWELLTGTKLEMISANKDITATALSDCSNKLVIAEGDTVYLYEKKDKYDKIKELSVNGTVSSIYITGDYFILGDDKGGITLLDSTFALKSQFNTSTSSRIISISGFSSEYFVTITRTCLAKYSIKDENCEVQIKGDFTALETSGDVIITGAVNGIVTLWNRKLEFVKSYKAHSKDVTTLLMHPDKTKLLSASRDRRISVIDLNKEWYDNKGYNSCVYLSYNGSEVYSVSDNCELINWEFNNNTVKSTVVCTDFDDDLFALDTSSDGRYFAVSVGDDMCKLWDKITKEYINLPQTTNNTFVNAVRFSYDGRYLAVNSVGDSYYAASTILSIYDLEDINSIKLRDYSRAELGLFAQKDRYNEIRRLSEQDNKYYILHINGAYGLAFSKDNKYLAIAMSDNSVLLYDHINNRKIKFLRDGLYKHTNEVKTIAFTPDRRFLISGSWDNNAILWNLELGVSIGLFRAHTRGIYAMDISRCGKYLITGARDHTIILWSIEECRLIKRFVHTSAVNSIKFIYDDNSPIMRFIAGFDSGEVLCLEVQGNLPEFKMLITEEVNHLHP